MSFTNLNENEIKVLKAVRENIRINTGCEFGWTDEIRMGDEGLSANQTKGYLSSLQKKIESQFTKLIFIQDKF